MKNNKKIISYLLSFTLTFNPYFYTSAINNTKNHNSQYEYLETDEDSYDFEDQDYYEDKTESTSLLQKIKNFVLHPLAIPIELFALLFCSKKTYDHFNSKNNSNQEQLNQDQTQFSNTDNTNPIDQKKSNQNLNSENHETTEEIKRKQRKESERQKRIQEENERKQREKSERQKRIQEENERKQREKSERQKRIQEENERKQREESERQRRIQEENERKQREESERQRLQKIDNDATLKANKLASKLYDCIQINNARNALVEINGPAIIIGDLHGDLDAAALARDQVDRFLNENENNHAIFLGDYFNKKSYQYESEEASFEVLEILTNLQLDYGNRVILLRGNHEEAYSDNFNNFKYYGNFTSLGFQNKANAESIDKKINVLKSNQKNIATIKEFCSSLPIAAEVTSNNQKILCLHGFIPIGNDYSWLQTLKTNNSSSIPIDIKRPLLCNFYTKNKNNSNSSSGLCTVDCVCDDDLYKFLKQNNYKSLIRGHSHDKFASRDIFNNGHCYSIHSNIHDFYSGSSGSNTAGILLFDSSGNISTKIEYKKSDKDYTDAFNHLTEVSSHKTKINEITSNSISVPPEKFMQIVNNYRGAVIFRGCYFQNIESAEQYEKNLFTNISQTIKSNPVKFGAVGGNAICFAHNIYRALHYATTRQDGFPMSCIYLAYNIDDTVSNYFKNDRIDLKSDNNNIIICNLPFRFEKKNYENITNISYKTFGYFRENFPQLEQQLKNWVKNCIGEKNTDILWKYFKDDIKIET